MECKEQLLKLGSSIRARRGALQVSQEDFAHKISLDRSYIGQIERGERNLSFCNLSKIAHGLGLSLSQLVEDI